MAIKELLEVTDDDGPFTYTYITVYSIPGLKMPENGPDTILIHEYEDANSQIFLTKNWDEYCQYFDQYDATISLIWSAFTGKKRFGKYSLYWEKLLKLLFGAHSIIRRNRNREIKRARNRRHKKHSLSRVYLVYKATGDIVGQLNVSRAKKFEGIGHGIDLFDGKIYREINKSLFNSAITAFMLKLEESNIYSEINKIGDVIFLTGNNDLVLYGFKILGGKATCYTTSMYAEEIFNSLSSTITNIITDAKVEHSVSLFIQSRHVEEDNLRAFIPAFAALELLVNRLAKVNRSTWQELLESGLDGLPEWDKDLRTLRYSDYRLRDKFYSVACMFDIDNASSDIARFINVNDRRSDYYHEADVEDGDLPTSDAQSLFLKYFSYSIN